ncbi:related to rRNA-processing protein FYV7 [Saccharomycodes ludwigii]|uniref:rRNA-processing protein FYV7 n=1 Tax=Saccharomycodes ludwigii TaxID=36035 RepID=A0A376B5U0_9ASCO|nr:hypothetical protein SCDLUD_000845 [Saccharomycodes ludwigii]KAH3903226.1 hypothetical protein SCDLUD_000845 [Saccharomycodes ludwigii]SSD60065.1 related to rRNA-processing protein FYV7 [Saccharomycodes ludwigii]
MPPKKSLNAKKFTREYKLKEIQRNLTRKSRLKKQYLKALKEEGYAIPQNTESDEHLDGKNTATAKLTGRDRKVIKRQNSELKYEEKKKLKQERLYKKRQDREFKREKELNRIKEIKSKHQTKIDRREKLAQRTKTGQPLMGPRIEDLLNKIKNDDTYTN